MWPNHQRPAYSLWSRPRLPKRGWSDADIVAVTSVLLQPDLLLAGDWTAVLTGAIVSASNANSVEWVVVAVTVWLMASIVRLGRSCQLLLTGVSGGSG